MPIVVDAVVISVDVNNEAASRSDAPSGSSGNPSDADRQQIVSECVERVLEILAAKQER